MLRTTRPTTIRNQGTLAPSRLMSTGPAVSKGIEALFAAATGQG
jgi:hypothetical protein